MSKLYISIIATFIAVSAVAVCGVELVFAQESGTSGAAEATSPPPSSGDSGTGMPPPPYNGTAVTPPPPPYDYGEGTFPPPDMQGRPPQQGTGGSYGEAYQKEYEQQYRKEMERQIEQRRREMQSRPSLPPRQGSGEFGSERQPFQKGMLPERGSHEYEGRDDFSGDEGFRGFGGGEFGGDEFGGREGEEGFEEREKMMEEREKIMQQEQLKQMKRGMISGMERGLKQIRKMMDKLSKKGITIPSDAQALVSELSNALETIRAATELTEEVEAAMEVIQEKGQDLADVGQMIGMLERLSQVEKQIVKEFTRINKAVAKAKKSKVASQYPDIVSKIEGEVGALKGKWESARNSMLSLDDGEDMRDAVDEIFEEVGEVHRSIAILQQLSSVSKMIKSADKEIATAEREIARQKKAGNDVTRLTELLGEAKRTIAEVKALAKQSGFDPEDLFDLMQELEKIGSEAHDELDRLNGKTETAELKASVIAALQMRRLGF